MLFIMTFLLARLVESESNLKVVQAIMDHANYKTAMNNLHTAVIRTIVTVIGTLGLNILCAMKITLIMIGKMEGINGKNT